MKHGYARWLFCLGLLQLWAGTAQGLGVEAGTAISNTAEVSFELAGTPVTRSSNTAVVTVAEVLDVDVLLQSPTLTVQAGDTDQALLYTVTNTGNGPETFTLSGDSVLAGDDFDPLPATPAIYFDTDGSGDLSPADTPYVAGSNDPALAPDESVDVLFVHGIPAGLPDGNRGLARLGAEALTGTGTPGQVFAGAGAGGTDAVVGTSGAQDAADGEYVVGDVVVELVKSVTVSDPFGGAQPIPGAELTYTLVATVTGAGTAVAVTIRDPIPANTTYLAGSISLNGSGLTDDGADADGGEFIASPAEIVVQLGDLTAASGAQTVTFTVTID